VIGTLLVVIIVMLVFVAFFASFLLAPLLVLVVLGGCIHAALSRSARKARREGDSHSSERVGFGDASAEERE
jgi:hypothetical protein